MPVKIPKQVKYEPAPVRKLLVDMKNYSSLMLDLAYYAATFSDERLALEVYRLEDHVDRMWSLTVMQASLAVRDAEDAESMVSVFRIADALDKVSDAAADIAALAIRGIKPNIALSAMLLSEEAIAGFEVSRDSPIAGKSLGEIYDELDITLDVILLRRGVECLLAPPPEAQVLPGDFLVVRGTIEALEKLAKAAGASYSRPKQPKDEDIQRLVLSLQEMKDLSDVALDLAFHAATWYDKDVAMLVLEIEDSLDDMQDEIQKMLFNLGGKIDENTALAAHRIVSAIESVSDAAAEMVGAVVASLPIHPIVREVVEESEEKILRAEVEVSKKISELGLDEHGVSVVAVKRGRRWYPLPSDNFQLLKGDHVVLRCYSENLDDIVDYLKSVGLAIRL